MALPTNSNAETYQEAQNVPPKYPLTTTTGKPPVINTIQSLVLYVGLGYLLLGRWDLLLIIFGVLLLHEAGHFLAMKYFSYADVKILFLPFLGALVRGAKNEISQRQSIIILLAGPVPGLVLGIVLYFLTDTQVPEMHIGAVPLSLIAQLLIWANLLNLLPIYPLDGGQLLNRVYLEEEGLLSDIYFYLSMAIIAALAIVLHFYVLLAIPALLIYKYIRNRSNTKLDKEIAIAGIDVYKSYEALSDTDYWKLRKLVLAFTPGLHHVNAGPPYAYHSNEQKIAEEVEATLSPRILLLDASLPSKIILAFAWCLAIVAPWLLQIDFTLFRYFSR